MRRGAIVLATILVAACGEVDPNAPLTGPERLSETGLYSDLAARRLADRVIAVRPRWPLWSDGAEKQRWILLPEGARIDTSDMDAWRFPVGTKVWKEFSRDGRLLETRLLEKRREPDDGGWFQMAYAWSEDESDAIAAPAGVKGARGTDYDIPAQRACGSCHYRGEKPIIGVSPLQLSTSADGPAPIAALPLSAAPSRVYEAPGTGEVQAALGYLHGNCSHCHDSRGAAAAEVKVFMQLSSDDTVPEQTPAYTSLVGQPIHHFPEVPGLSGLVVPGEPDQSLVPYRMARRDAAQMPPIATNRVDDAGLATIRAWIMGLAQ